MASSLIFVFCGDTSWSTCGTFLMSCITLKAIVNTSVGFFFPEINCPNLFNLSSQKYGFWIQPFPLLISPLPLFSIFKNKTAGDEHCVSGESAPYNGTLLHCYIFRLIFPFLLVFTFDLICIYFLTAAAFWMARFSMHSWRYHSSSLVWRTQTLPPGVHYTGHHQRSDKNLPVNY